MRTEDLEHVITTSISDLVDHADLEWKELGGFYNFQLFFDLDGRRKRLEFSTAADIIDESLEEDVANLVHQLLSMELEFVDWESDK